MKVKSYYVYAEEQLSGDVSEKEATEIAKNFAQQRPDIVWGEGTSCVQVLETGTGNYVTSFDIVR